MLSFDQERPDYADTKTPEGRYMRSLFGDKYDDPFRDLFFGIFSGYPYCCVKFFVTCWSPMFADAFSGEAVREARKAAEATYGPQSQRTQYVQCPACLEKEDPIYRVPYSETYGIT